MTGPRNHAEPERLRTFTPGAEYQAYKVTVEDELGISFTLRIAHALGPRDAMNQASDRILAESGARVTGITAAAFHDDPECGYLWSEHDNRTPHNRLPFGCPSEAMVRLRYGDR